MLDSREQVHVCLHACMFDVATGIDYDASLLALEPQLFQAPGTHTQSDGVSSMFQTSASTSSIETKAAAIRTMSVGVSIKRM